MIPVGITQRISAVREYPETRTALDVRWPAFLAACGLLAVPLPNDAGLAPDYAASLGLRGLILSGGENLVAYGGSGPERDDAETALLRWFTAEGLPVFGVCRGMQFLLHTFGARLEEVDGHVATEHDIELIAGGRRTVNSYHRWAATTVASPLVVTARAGAVVEAVRHESAPIRGIMWHPERVAGFAREDVDEFTVFFGGAR